MRRRGSCPGRGCWNPRSAPRATGSSAALSASGGAGAQHGAHPGPGAPRHALRRRGPSASGGQPDPQPAQAEALRHVAEAGPQALQRGPIADAVLAATAAHPIPGWITAADLAPMRRAGGSRSARRSSRAASAAPRPRLRAASACCSRSRCWRRPALPAGRRRVWTPRICCWRRAGSPAPTGAAGLATRTRSACRRTA
ncbi:hypothetical protein Ddc_24852 [Ditylenchus destructor]|nr:hypothetical protein Ddc_24852 [Ditylenchus destructor]